MTTATDRTLVEVRLDRVERVAAETASAARQLHEYVEALVSRHLDTPKRPTLTLIRGGRDDA